MHADVVLRPGFAADAPLDEALRLHARAATAAYKAPRSLRFVDELPRTATGKVRRSAIREQLGLLPSDHGDAHSQRG